ncbi:MAG: CBS domain-containing protein [Hyphomicrobiaceae bacterium]|nr:MAG: CBS domain-containing protein [Hyphomicrobiaceae bacterium]
MALTQARPESRHSASTPLLALKGVVLDTETTGLDAKSARIVQIGALRFAGGSVENGERFERLVNPGIPIPRAASAIHGISDAQVQQQPKFAAVAPELEAFLGTSVLIGHTTSYDVTVLREEYGRAGRPWSDPRTLDVRILAEFVQPTLAQYDLERLCEWLGVQIEGRHTAMGDALATGRVFAALLPLLRQRGVRTLAEAEAVSRSMAQQREQVALGLHVEGARAGDASRPIARLDNFAYRHRIRDVMNAPPAIVPATATVRDAVRILLDRKISSVFVDDGTGAIGIVTERDLLRAHAEPGAGMDTALGAIMKRPLQSVSEDDFLYRAIGRMERLGFRHLAVRNGRGDLVGAVTTRNLLRDRATTAIMLGDEIDSATDEAALAHGWHMLPVVAESLAADDVDPRTIASVVSAEICVLTRRAAELAEARLAEAGRGGPPVPYTVLVLGSAGRGESLLAADQDNAIVYETGGPGGAEDQWFAALGAHIADILDAAGVPYCKGGVMARNPQWRMSLAAWKETIDTWVRRQRPQDLLNVDIFFDGVPVHGDWELGEAIWSYAYDAGHRNPPFLNLLTELARDWRSPITFFGNFRNDAKGRVDLKKGGLMPLFTAARVLSLRHDVRARSTPERLRGVAAAGAGSASDIEAIIEAHRLLIGTILDQQLEDTHAGVPLSPRVDVARLTKDARDKLRAALGQVATVVDLVGEGRL